MLSQVALFVWLAAVPTPSSQHYVVFGPFADAARCEETYRDLARYRIGGSPISHECRAVTR